MPNENFSIFLFTFSWKRLKDLFTHFKRFSNDAHQWISLNDKTCTNSRSNRFIINNVESLHFFYSFHHIHNKCILTLMIWKPYSQHLRYFVLDYWKQSLFMVFLWRRTIVCVCVYGLNLFWEILNNLSFWLFISNCIF